MLKFVTGIRSMPSILSRSNSGRVALLNLARKQSTLSLQQKVRSSYKFQKCLGFGLVLAALAQSSSVARAQNSNFNIQGADALYDNGQGDKTKVFEYLTQLNQSSPNNPEVLWRLCRATYDVAQLKEKTPEEKKILIHNAHALAGKSLELDDSNFACHKWYAITLTSVNDYQGYKEKIANAYKMKEHFETASRLNPKDATCHHLVGLWHFNIADMSWVSRNAAKALFGTPPSSTYEAALGYFQAAEDVDPNFYTKNTLYMGLTNMRLGNKATAKEWFMKVLAMEVHNADDQEAHDEAKRHL